MSFSPRQRVRMCFFGVFLDGSFDLSSKNPYKAFGSLPLCVYLMDQIAGDAEVSHCHVLLNKSWKPSSGL